jgi:hypothetical protein
MHKRRRLKQQISLKDRLAAFAEQARESAKQLIGPEREMLLRKARIADTAARIDEWSSSPGLQPPE